ncbi:MAG: hypothetical protein Q4F88_03640 [Eubacteriales bacterium]|nr:hypothetical protein [Eubacteriales bacterium]
MSKNKNIKIVVICIITIVLLIILFSLKNKFFNIDIKSQSNIKSTNSYINKGNYINSGNLSTYTQEIPNYRKVEYIGGINYNLQREYNISSKEERYNGVRWYPFYRDKDTSEILRGLERINYITAGIPFVGLDHYDTPNDRKTQKGFSDYVKKWTGSVLYGNYSRFGQYGLSDKSSYDNSKGIYYCESYDYDKPIDLLISDIWFNTKYIKRSETYNIDDIVKAINFGSYKMGNEDITFFSENDWILYILRNTIGYISDDFYDIVYNNKINLWKLTSRIVQ